MGMSKIEIISTGNHGCDRRAKEGESLAPKCSAPSCVDCRARDLVDALKASGSMLGPDTCSVTAADGTVYKHGATMTHWPGTDGTVTDDLAAGKRVKGHF